MATRNKKAPKEPEALDPNRAPTGIPGLDDLITGGIERESNVLVMGGPGSGKTTFLVQFLVNGALKYNEPGLFLTFEEQKETLVKHMSNFGWDLNALEDEGMFTIITYKPHEVKKLLDEGGGMIWDSIHSIKAKRLAVDSLSTYAMLFDTNYQMRESQLLLFDLLRKWNITTLLSGEAKNASAIRQFTGMEYLTDGVILLHHPRQGNVRIRALEILKLRGVGHSQKICPFEFIEGKGIEVYPDEDVFSEM